MYIRKKPNKSGSVSVQIFTKDSGKYKFIKTIGSSSDKNEIDNLVIQAHEEIKKMSSLQSMFIFEKDQFILEFIHNISNNQIRTVGPELIFGKIYDKLGYNAIADTLFRHLVISRLSFPLSKLKTVDYLQRYLGIELKVDKIYRFMDKLSDRYKPDVEQISFKRTKELLKGEIGIVFYDMTTLYFEASDEDDLRQPGFSKDGKHSNPQIFLGLLVGLEGYAIGYDIFEGGIYEGHTLIPFIERIKSKFDIDKPIIVADSGLLNQKNINYLKELGYQFILGGRVKNESKDIKEQILQINREDGHVAELKGSKGDRLILSYSLSRAKKDKHNREKGLKRLEKKIKSNKLTKKDINNKGYTKYLKMLGEIKIEIDYEKFEEDAKWDGIKGYVTNTTLAASSVIDNYKELWNIERAFRMSKTDLRIRPIYHRLRRRIEAHICISFVAYSIYKDLERALKLKKSEISVRNAYELTQNIYQIEITLPESNVTEKIMLKLSDKQQELINLINEFF
ncbi:hypothetical protein DOJK_00653 [Patescibacteria group bacterium]|nr:hypothetical protein DOJK_00653 [Patescibacteria group bacterium]